jgi:hypothetical protein
MAQPTYVRPPEIESGDIVYRPVSILAVFGFALAALYALMIVGTAAMAFFTSKPLKLGAWTFLFPVVAAALAAAGWWQVRSSEGTRVGLGLARWGVRLSLLFGLGYAAYLVAIGMALGMETDQYATKWFDKLREGDVGAAFLLTLDPLKREGINSNNPEDMARFTIPGEMGQSALGSFENQQIIRLIRQAGKEAEVTHLGLGPTDWEFAQEAYVVKQAYRVRTREGEFDFVLTFRTSLDKPGRKAPRQWWMFHCDMLGAGKPSEFGAVVAAWSRQASDFTNRWMSKLGMGDFSGAYWDTVDPVERQRQAEEYRRRMIRAACLDVGASGEGGLSGGATLLAARQWSGEKDLRRDVRLFGEGALFQWKVPSLADEKTQQEQRTRMMALLQLAFTAPPGRWRMAASPSSGWSRWEEVGPDRFRFNHAYLLVLMDTEAQKGYRYEVNVWAEDDPGPTDLERLPDWRILHLDIVDTGVIERGNRQGPGPDTPKAPPPSPPAPIGSPFQR